MGPQSGTGSWGHDEPGAGGESSTRSLSPLPAEMKERV